MRVIRDAVAGSDYRELPGNSARRRASHPDTPRSECFDAGMPKLALAKLT
jgi:hypothetical protein